MAKVSAIVVAAGKSERFEGKENKIFAHVDGQPLFLRALQLFVNREDVCQTLLVVAPADTDQIKAKYGPNLGFMGIRLVQGGRERFDSVSAGLAAVAEEADFVAIHDAARVCLAAEWIDRVFEAAFQSGAAVPVTPVTATLKRVGQDRILGDTVPRDGLWMAQTPQVFRKDLLQAAYQKLYDDRVALLGHAAVTDDAQVVTAAGFPVTAVDGDARNVKITSKDDLKLASAVLKILPQKATPRAGAFEEAQW